MDITGPYPISPRRNRYLLTFIDHFSKYSEAFRIEDHTAETCARVYVSQIVARHGSGSKLITDQGAAFVSTFLMRHVMYLASRGRGPLVTIRNQMGWSKDCIELSTRGYRII
jgi:hypothetical protein